MIAPQFRVGIIVKAKVAKANLRLRRQTVCRQRPGWFHPALIIATFTTITTLALEAYAYDLYLKIALFVQIIVTNCMILGRAEAFASRHGPVKTFLDAAGTALGFAIALLLLGSVREVLAFGTLLADAELLFGTTASGWQINLGDTQLLPLAAYAPGALLIAGLMFAAANAMLGKARHTESQITETGE